MPFQQAWSSMGRTMSGHNGTQHSAEIPHGTVAEQRANIARADAEAARPGIDAVRRALNPRITPDNIDQHIATTQRDLEKARADAGNASYSSSSRATARQHIQDHTRRLDKLNELRSTLPGGNTISTRPAPKR